jgi:hypothetical protein
VSDAEKLSAIVLLTGVFKGIGVQRNRFLKRRFLTEKVFKGSDPALSPWL